MAKEKALSNAFVVTVFLMLASYVSADGYAVITLNDAIKPISKAKAKMLFIGKTKSLKPVGKVQLLDWPSASKQKQDFYKKLMNKSESQVNGAWASLSFSGKARPPDAMQQSDVNEVEAWLSSHPKGVAYVPASLVPPNATVLLTVK